MVEMFLSRLGAGGARWTARGQCVEHSGEGNRTCPSWKRWGAWGASPPSSPCCGGMHRCGWPNSRAGERAGARAAPGPPARDDTGPHARELAEALEVLTTDRTLVLVLEDLQWSDPSTVEALTYLAQRPEPARLLVLGTYRPVEVLLQGHRCAAWCRSCVGGGRGESCGWSS